jgi:hypothetical protein
MLGRSTSFTVGSALIAAALVATVTTGIADASLKSSAVKACVSHKGVLSLLNKRGKCAKGSTETSIGAQGAKGARGAPGARGATGPSHAYSVTYPIETNLDNGQTANVGHTSLPAGDYDITATLVVGTIVDDSMQTICTLYSNHDGSTDGTAIAVQNDTLLGGAGQSSMTLQGTAKFASSTDLVIGCDVGTLTSDVPGGTILGSTAQGQVIFNAIKVGAIN